ncbi:MAG: hypothetical protein MI922_09930, partial [Bacteroidales bacterium]|nr:hypothetical protein [Bacteroidales bacterium]
FYFVPKKGSKVLISRVRNSDDFFVSQFGEVDKFILKTDNTNLDFVIPGGDESDNDNFQLSFGEDTIISINGTSVDITQGESKINMAEGIVNVSQGEKTNMVLDESTVTLTQDSATMELAGENITLNGGGNKGMVMVKELTDKLNTIENLLLKFVPLYDTHFHPSAVGPTGPTTSIVSETIAPTQQTEIENTNVMH